MKRVNFDHRYRVSFATGCRNWQTLVKAGGDERSVGGRGAERMAHPVSGERKDIWYSTCGLERRSIREGRNGGRLRTAMASSRALRIQKRKDDNRSHTVADHLDRSAYVRLYISYGVTGHTTDVIENRLGYCCDAESGKPVRGLEVTAKAHTHRPRRESTPTSVDRDGRLHQIGAP